jgi:hypothetical protein
MQKGTEEFDDEFDHESCCIRFLVIAAASASLPLAKAAEQTSDKPANNLEIVHDKLKADKKLILRTTWS